MCSSQDFISFFFILLRRVALQQKLVFKRPSYQRSKHAYDNEFHSQPIGGISGDEKQSEGDFKTFQLNMCLVSRCTKTTIW